MRSKNTQFIYSQTYTTLNICDTALLPENQFATISKNIDQIMHSGKQLEDEDTCSVFRVTNSDYDIVIKRFNSRSIYHRISRAFRRSRASLCWENAFRLISLGIKTPRPIAMIERRFGPVRRTAYYIAEYVPGIRLDDYFAQEINTDQKLGIAHQIVAALNLLRKHCIRHRDTKATNFLVYDANVYLIDLDGMRRYSKLRYMLSKAAKKDRQRFLSNWNDTPHILELYTKLFNDGNNYEKNK